MSADQAPASPPIPAPRGYFADEGTPTPARAPTPVVSKSGELPRNEQALAPQRLYEARYLIALALRREGRTYKEIEKETGLSKGQILYAFYKLRESGQLDDTQALLDRRAVPQAVDNLMAALEEPTNKNHWDATMEVLKGRGALRKFNNNQSGGGGGERMPNLQIAIISPDGGDKLPTVIVNSEVGSVVGSAREDDDA